MSTVAPSPTRRRAGAALRVVAVVGLLVDAYVHLILAADYDAIGDAVTQGVLFRAEAAAAVLAALWLVFRDTRAAWLVGGLVAAAGTAALLVTRYVEVPALGPLPSMYEPVWYPEKVWVVVAMAATVAAWLARESLRRRRG